MFNNLSKRVDQKSFSFGVEWGHILIRRCRRLRSLSFMEGKSGWGGVQKQS